MTDTLICSNSKNRRKCVGMTKEEAKQHFENSNLKFQQIIQTNVEMKKLLEKIMDSQQTQRDKQIYNEKDIEFLKDELKTNKEAVEKKVDINKKEIEKEVNRLHESLRRRDKKVMWLTTLIVTVGGILTNIIAYFKS